MRKYTNMMERLLSNSVVDDSGCWVWLGKTNRSALTLSKGRTNQYGQLNVRENGKHITKTAHRVSYEVFKEESIPEEYTVDHLCCNPLCINPEHMELVSLVENNKRQWRRKWYTGLIIPDPEDEYLGAFYEFGWEREFRVYA